MKKLIFNTLLVIALGFNASAQNDSIKKEAPRTSGSICFHLGPTFPVGQFKDEAIGGAGSGAIAGVSFGIPLKRSNFGIAARFENSSMDQTGTAFLNKQKAIGSRTSGLAPLSYNIDTVSSYRQFNFMVGLYMTKPSESFNRLVIDGRVLIGYNRTVKDEVAMRVTNKTTGYTGYFYEGGAVSDAFCFDLGASLRLNLGKRQHFCLSLNADYVGAKGEFKINNYAFRERDGQTYLEDYNETLNFSVSAVNVTVGVGFVFIKKQKK